MREVSHRAAAGGELVPLFARHLQLCRVTQDELVLAFTNTMTNPLYPAALDGACGELGADFVQVVVPGNDDWLSSRAIVEAWKAADLVVGMTATTDAGWEYSDAHNEALDAGTRTLMIEEPADVLRRLFPVEPVRRRGVAGQQLLAAGASIRLWSAAGTDLIMHKTGRPASVQYGVSDTPGRWDHWPSGLVACAPLEESANGVLVLDEGDLLLHLNRYVAAPVRCTLRDGRIVKVDGGTDARLLADFLASAQDPKAYAVSHVGWGTDDRMQWHVPGLRFWEGGGVVDSEGFYGGVTIAFGSNIFKGLAGTNDSRFHTDVPMRNHSLWVDDQQVLDEGRFVLPNLA